MWFKHVLKNNCQHHKATDQILKKKHKFGIELPKSVEQALALDAKNGNAIWEYEVSKEMENVRVAIEVLPGGKLLPIGHHFV